MLIQNLLEHEKVKRLMDELIVGGRWRRIEMNNIQLFPFWELLLLMAETRVVRFLSKY